MKDQWEVQDHKEDIKVDLREDHKEDQDHVEINIIMKDLWEDLRVGQDHREHQWVAHKVDREVQV
jgi:hypothetical protein